MSRQQNSLIAIILSLLTLNFISTSEIDESTVHVLNKKFFDEFIKDNIPILVMFYAPWCGHCKALKPAFEKAAVQMKGKVKLGKVDCDVETELCKQQKVTGQPTLKVFKDDKMTDYKGGRKTDDIIKEMTGSKPEVNESNVVSLTEKTFDNFIKLDKDKLVHFYDPTNESCEKLRPEFAEAATTLVETSRLAKVDCTVEVDLCKKQGISQQPAIQTFKNDESKQYIGEKTTGAIVEFMEELKLNIDESEVHVLTETNFDEFIKEDGIKLIQFYAPWCGHCKSLKPEFAKAALELKNKVKLAKIDVTVHTKISEKYKIEGQPTIKIFHDSNMTDYSGSRKFRGIVEQMIKFTLPDVSVILSKDEFFRFKNSSAIICVLYSDAQDSNYYINFRTVAKKLRSKLSFASVEDATLLSEVGDKGSIFMFRNFDDVPVALEEKSGNVDKLLVEIKNNMFPDQEEVGPENQMNYIDRELPLVWLFQDYGDKIFNDQLNIFSEVSKLQRNKYSFIQLDSVKYKEQVDYMRVTKNPGISIQDNDEQKFILDAEYSLTNFKKFMEDQSNGILKPDLKSEEIEKQTEAVFKVVGKNFEDEVMKYDKDILIEFYSPTCGHCKALEPIYTKLAEAQKQHDNIRIAKMDAVSNDVGNKMFEVDGFPALQFLNKDKKDKPIKQEGNRTIIELSKFIIKNTSVKILDNPIEKLEFDKLQLKLEKFVEDIQDQNKKEKLTELLINLKTAFYDESKDIKKEDL